jgi:hypothetical protein
MKRERERERGKGIEAENELRPPHVEYWSKCSSCTRRNYTTARVVVAVTSSAQAVFAPCDDCVLFFFLNL